MPGPEHPPGDDQEEEHRLQAGGAGRQHAQRRSRRGEHAQHGDRLGVDATRADSSASTSIAIRPISTMKTTPASLPCPSSSSWAPGWIRNGQPKATTPTDERPRTSSRPRRATGWGSRRRSGRLDARRRPSAGRTGCRILATCGANAGEPASTAGAARRRPRRRRRARRRGWPPRRPARRRAWPGPRRDRRGEAAQERHQALLGRRSPGRGSARRAAAARGSDARIRPARGTAAAPRRGRAGAGLGSTPGRIRSSSRGRVVPGARAKSRSALAHSSATVSAYRMQRRVLGHQPARRTIGAGCRARRVEVTEPDAAARRGELADQARQQGRLAGAVAAHQRDHLAGAHLQVHVAQGGHVAAAYDEPA